MNPIRQGPGQAGVWVARSLGLWVCLPEAGQGPPQLSA